jgi:hypothetical protein
MGAIFAVSRRGAHHTVPIAFIAALLLAMLGSLSLVAACSDDFGPQLTVDRLVAERGATVTVTLNGFPAGQRFVVSARATMPLDQSTAVASLPVDVDAGGGGIVSISTVGLATGDYIVSAASEGAADLPIGVGTAFGVIDPQTLGPRAVRVHSLSADENG